MVKRKIRDKKSKYKHWTKMVKKKTRDKNSKVKNTGQKC